jgi:hypothetical protein
MKRLALALLLSLTACGGSRPQANAPQGEPAVVLVPSERLAPPFVVQQKLTGRHGERDFSLDVVVQLSRGKLTLMGLTPFGSRAFVLEQVGTNTSLQTFVARELPVRPGYVLADVHRVFFRGLPAPQSDGEHSALDHGERVTERWQGGVLLERRFASSASGKDDVVATFEGAPAPRIAPRVRLQSRTFGYTLVIDNVMQQLLAE